MGGVLRGMCADPAGFFHWELEFAQVFGRGAGMTCRWGIRLGFRPRWEEAPVLAEVDPWLMLDGELELAEWRLRRGEALSFNAGFNYLLE